MVQVCGSLAFQGKTRSIWQPDPATLKMQDARTEQVLKTLSRNRPGDIRVRGRGRFIQGCHYTVYKLPEPLNNCANFLKPHCLRAGVPNLCIPTDARAITSKVGGRRFPIYERRTKRRTKSCKAVAGRVRGSHAAWPRISTSHLYQRWVYNKIFVLKDNFWNFEIKEMAPGTTKLMHSTACTGRVNVTSTWL